MYSGVLVSFTASAVGVGGGAGAPAVCVGEAVKARMCAAARQGVHTHAHEGGLAAHAGEYPEYSRATLWILRLSAHADCECSCTIGQQSCRCVVAR